MPSTTTSRISGKSSGPPRDRRRRHDAPPVPVAHRSPEIIHAVHAEVIVPVTVWSELVIARPAAPGVASLLASPWIRVNDEAERAGVDTELVAALDRGEAAAIALAELLRADTLLID